jgi:site-specific DNA recombinase
MAQPVEARAPDQPWALTAATLRQRDHDPAYADAPVLDVYGRISRNPETGETEKVDRQLIDCLREVERRQARLGKTLRDDGQSAWKRTAKRDGWQTLVERLESGAANGVICWHTDRLMRQPYDLEYLIRLGDRGYLLASCHGDYDLADADDRFTLRVLTAAACKESDNTSRRQKRKAKAMREKGNPGGGPRAFGFPGNERVSKEERERVRKAGEKLPKVPADQVEREREAIRWGIEKHIDGGLTLTAIAAEWNARGLRTTAGEEFEVSGVRQILERGRNAGLIEHNGKTVGREKDEHGKPVETVVSEEQLERLRAKLAARRRGRPTTGEHLLSGILRCGECGGPLTAQPVGAPRRGAAPMTYDDGTPRRKYVCRKPNGCGGVTIDQRRADGWARDKVLDVLADPKHAEQIAKRSRAVADLDTRIAEAEATAREIGDRLGRGELSLDRYDAITGPLDRRLADLRAKRDKLLALGTAGAPASASDRVDLERDWDTGTNAERRNMIRQAMPLAAVVLPATTRGRGADVSARLVVRKR